MSWFRRQRDRDDPRATSSDVASELAGFVVHATESRALLSAIDASLLALRDADGYTTPTSEVANGIVARSAEEAGDE